MSRWVPVNIVGGFYTDDAWEWACQDTVNYIPRSGEVEGTKTPTILVDAPGLKPFALIKLPVSPEPEA
ncbi:hypothetical protein ACYX7E_09925 [Luteimonas sp. RIT-PG2_3]